MATFLLLHSTWHIQCLFTSLYKSKLYINFTIHLLICMNCLCEKIVKILEVYTGNTGTPGINYRPKSPSGDGWLFCVVPLCVLVWASEIFWWSPAVCLPPEAAPSASMINAAAYLPSLGSGVPFLLLYPAAPAAGTERTRRGLFLLQLSPWHHKPTTDQDQPNHQKYTKKPQQPQTINQSNQHCLLYEILLKKTTENN